jgi:ABC-type branched-subunit amino acid transport system substrate-binding protein
MSRVRAALRAALTGGSLGLLGLLALVALGLSLVVAVPTFKSVPRQVAAVGPSGTGTVLGQPTSNKPGAKTGTKGGPGTIAGPGTGPIAGPGAGPVAGPGGEQCERGRNGGSTDVGVSNDRIKLAATVVRSGIGSAFLGGAPVAMQAVVDQVNAQGGICGRLLDLKMRDDGWDANIGASTLRSLIAEKPFALPVVPSSEGLRILIDSGDIDKAQIPVVGSDGMLVGQYKDPWVWPVATSTQSAMHIIVKSAYDKGARSFGLVYETTYHFGLEGARAYNQAVKNLMNNKDIPGYADPDKSATCRGTFCGIQAGQSSYSNQVNTFNNGCKEANALSKNTGAPSCDLVALLLEPGTALTWIANGGIMPKDRTMAPQPLFNADFARACGGPCDSLQVWTGYKPPLPPFDALPAQRQYASTVHSRESSLDITNSFTQGAYLGMRLTVDAIRQVGPRLTRQALKAVLDSVTYDSGLSTPLSWRPGKHFANGSMMSYRMRYQAQTFGGFQRLNDFVRDPWLGEE